MTEVFWWIQKLNFLKINCYIIRFFTHSDQIVETCMAKIDENFTNDFLRTWDKNKCLVVLCYK